jgi:hypothetical protein
MPSQVERQRAFIKRHSTIQPFWGEVEDISLVSAALLTLGINPSSLDEEMEAYGEPVSVEELPDDFLPRIEVLRSAIRAGKLNTVALIYDKFEFIDEQKTRIRTDDFVEWCNAKGIKHNVPNRTAPIPTTKWPWGGYETELLRKLASAAEEWWSTYDPVSPATAPTNQEVKNWLVGQGVSDRVAESMATILRADGLATGPRRP